MGPFLMVNKELALKFLQRKKRRKRAAIISAVCSLLLTMFIVIAFCVMYVDKFTVTVSKDSLCLTIDETKEALTTKLEAPPLDKATDIQYSDLPKDIEDGLGSKNTNGYFSYSFYLGSSSSTNYSLSMILKHSSNELEKAIRVMIIRNGVRTIYAQANEDGSSKAIYYGETREHYDKILGYTTPFKDNRNIILEPYYINQDDFDRYTVVMWIDGWESVNSMKGGIVQTDLKFSTLSNT